MPFLVLLSVPIIEIWILIEIGNQIGALPTIAMIVLTASIGLSLLKRQGLSTLITARQRLENGALPASELVNGVMLAIGGALLLTPGFVTDGFGFLLMFPKTRSLILQKFLNRFRDKIIIEGEFRHIDDRKF